MVKSEYVTPMIREGGAAVDATVPTHRCANGPGSPAHRAGPRQMSQKGVPRAPHLANDGPGHRQHLDDRHVRGAGPDANGTEIGVSWPPSRACGLQHVACSGIVPIWAGSADFKLTLWTTKLKTS